MLQEELPKDKAPAKTGADGGTLPDNAVACFDHIDMWVFDLDNTLYPASSNLFAAIDARMKSFIAQALAIPPEEAWHIQKRYFEEYGTTLRGLMLHHDTDPRAFLDHVHDIDISPVAPAPRLHAALEALKGRKIVYTNGSNAHARRIMERLGIYELFHGVFDIVDAGYIPKPQKESYERLTAHFDLKPEKTVFFEDLTRNLAPAAAIGMTTVWVRNNSPWAEEAKNHEEPHIHHITDDLVGWIEALVEGQKPAKTA